MLDTGFRAKTRALGELTPCAQCGEAIVAPTWSEHVNERCVRHLWECILPVNKGPLDTISRSGAIQVRAAPRQPMPVTNVTGRPAENHLMILTWPSSPPTVALFAQVVGIG